MAESFRQKDMKAEEVLAEFMDKYFYSKLTSIETGLPVEFYRKKDKDSQLKGIDVELIVDDKIFKIDEKATMYYANVMLPTFAFEIDSIQKGHRDPVLGWFVNDELETDLYMLIWPNVRCDEKKGWVRTEVKSIDDFTIIEAMLIDKKKLAFEIAMHHSCDKKALVNYADGLRATMASDVSGRKEIKIDEEVKIMYSGALAEKPVNVIVKKSVLMSIANAIYYISKDGYAQVKEKR